MSPLSKTLGAGALQEFLATAHNDDGTLKGSALEASLSIPATEIGFYDADPVEQQVLASGSTADDIIDFLQLIGLCKES